MEVWLWVVIGMMAVVIMLLLVKIYYMRKSAGEIREAFADRLVTDTNALIDISSGDKYMRELANDINRQLREFRKGRHRFAQGDIELKNAVTNISHDLRTPLTAICGYLDLLEQEEQTEAAKRYVKVIRDRTGLLAQMTEELFRYSVITTTEYGADKETVIVNDVLEESIAAFYAALQEHGIVPDIQLPEVKVRRTLERSALVRVFSNLLNNAMKYSDGDLCITLTGDGEIVFSNVASDLNEVQVGRLFDRFYTVEAARKSTGLGLAIAKTLMEQMHGTISAHYEDGRLSVRMFIPEG